MDRARVVLPRLLLPLLGLSSVSLLWLVLCTGRPSDGAKVPAIAAVAVDRSPGCKNRSSPRIADQLGEAGRPELLTLNDSPHWLPPINERTWAILTTAFPPEDGPTAGTDETTSSGEGGPALFPAASGAPNSSHYPVTVVPENEANSGPASGQGPRPLAPAGPDGVAPDAPPEGAHTAASGPGILQQPAASPLPPADPSVARSKQLESVAQEADRQTRQGFELAGRRAYFAARAEFIMALRLVAQGLDAEHRNSAHTRALAAALTAIREAEDFIPRGGQLEADLDLAGIVRGHQTPVLKGAASENLAPMEALKCYFTFAQEQLATAAGREVAGSMALQGLGKLHSAQAVQHDAGIRAAESKAMVFYQAALLVCPQNYMASNDLGVLLARCGYYQEARVALEHSLSIYRQSAGWYNLTVVYGRLGQVELARRAQRLWELAQRAEAAGQPAQQGPSARFVQWVDPRSFAQSYAATPDAREAPPARRTPTRAAPPQPGSSAGQSLAQWPQNWSERK